MPEADESGQYAVHNYASKCKDVTYRTFTGGCQGLQRAWQLLILLPSRFPERDIFRQHDRLDSCD
jgi:hypothetical protein